MRRRFTALYDGNSPELAKYRKVQKEFFNSASNLCLLYNLHLPDTSAIPYPLNIHTCFVHLKEQCEKVCPHLTLAILQGSDQATALATLKPLDLHYSAYYLPILPIYEILKRKGTSGIRPVLLGIVRMIYYKFGFSFYREDESYIRYIYEYTEQMLEESPEDDECYFDLNKDLKKMKRVGDFVLREIHRTPKRYDFAQSVARFAPGNELDRSLKGLASKFIEHDHAFPDRRLVQEIPQGWLEPEAETRVPKDNFFCFIYDFCGALAESAESFIDSDFREAEAFDIPVGIQRFVSPHECEKHDLSYEEACLKLLDEFDDFLKCSSNEKH